MRSALAARFPSVERNRDLPTFSAHVERAVAALHVAAARMPGATLPEPPVLDAALPAPGPRLGRLVRDLDLEDDDVGFLWTAIALACDPRALPFAELLCGTDARRGASAALYAAAAALPPERARRLAVRLAGDHPLLARSLLVSAGGDGEHVFSAYAVAPRVVRHLAGDDRLDPALLGVGGPVVAPVEPVLDAAGEKLVLAIDEALQDGELVLLEGTSGSGRRALAAIAAQRRMRSVIALDLARVSRDPVALGGHLAALAREQALTGAVPLLAHLPTGPVPNATVFARFLDGRTAAVLTGEPGCDLPLDRRIVRLRVGNAGTAQRRALWRGALGDRGSEGLSAELAVRFKVSPGTITDVAQAVRRRPATPNADGVSQLVRRRMADRLAGLAEHVEVNQGWDDVVLAPDTHDQVRALLARCRNQHQVLESWGFARKLARGQGVAALFSGPPGTGKTMVAGLIARELGLDLYQVDLSRVVSKWVGETEKQLGRVFDAAEAGHIVLLFDEADALFGRRGEAKGAQDRWANLEVNYLLSRIESFGGISILTTNLDGSLDPAFRRRLAAHIAFWTPSVDERALLWRRMIPAEAPLDEGVDLEALAESYPELSGAHIRNAVVSAAFLASVEPPGDRITEDHLQRAARAEYRSMGRLLG